MPFFVVIFNVIQWLIAPYIIDAIYRVKEVKPQEDPELHQILDRLSRKSRIRKPKLMKAKIPLPNAFAYSSPLTGNKVAVTTGLLENLETEEVEAVIGHELGHLKHRDVQVMMFVSILPAIFYWIGYSMFFSSMFSRRDSRDSGGAAIIGLASLFLWMILTFFTLYLSRIREYYADRHSVEIVDDGSRKLSEGLAKIVHSTKNMKNRRRNTRDTGGSNSFKALFISDPDRSEMDSMALRYFGGGMGDRRLVDEVLRKRITTFDRIMELFSTHPNIVKRLKSLQKLG